MQNWHQTEPAARSGRQVAKRWEIPALLRSLRHRNYRLFFFGQLISLTGTWMQAVAQSWLVYRLTGSAVLLGLVGFSGQIPILLLAPFGGIVADRYARHRILVATQAASMILAFVLAALVLTKHIQVWHIFLIAALLGLVNAVDIPTRQSFVMNMVGRNDLANAIALNSSMFNGARIVGPALAGILVAAIGEGWCFFANAVSYIAVVAGLLMMRMEPQPRPHAIESALAGIAKGFDYVRRTKPVLALLLLLGGISIMGMPYTVLMPIFADQILHGGVRGLGLLIGASGIGAFLGAIVLATRKNTLGLGKWIALAAGGFGTCLMLFSLSRLFWLSLSLLVPVGFFMMVAAASLNTMIQTIVPDNLRGRVMALHTMMFMGMAPFGALLAGVLAHYFGAPVTVALGGAMCVGTALAFRRQLPALQREAGMILVPLDMIGRNMDGGVPKE